MKTLKITVSELILVILLSHVLIKMIQQKGIGNMIDAIQF
jgi:hypothetical protein